MNLNRRTFVKSSTVALTAIGMPALSYGRVRGANDKIRCAVVGLNGRGNSHINSLGDQVVAYCDCDEDLLGKRAEGKDVEKYVDYRKLLENQDIDVISIATPNHTHSLIGVQATMAGKDVYCEKPVSHNVWEGRQLVNAAKRYDRIVQCGTQSRSSPSLQQAVEFAQSGKLGKALYAIGTCYKPRKSIGKLDNPLMIPKHIDYDLWCGPAEKKPLYRPKLHYDWHWDFNTGNGDMGNQGIHQMDIARWFLGYDTLSPRVLSIGGRLGYDDAGDTPNTQTVIHDYAGAPLIFETRGLPRTKAFQKPDKWNGRNMDVFRGSRIGVIIQYENGYVVVPSYSNATAYDSNNERIKSWSGGGNHFTNFLDVVRSRDTSKLNGPILDGHLSSALCHTGGLSHQLGRHASVSEIEEKLSAESDIFKDSFRRMARHLKANKVDIGDGKAMTLGADLKMDPATERFLNNDSANQMLSRDYRSGFEVPEVTSPVGT